MVKESELNALRYGESNKRPQDSNDSCNCTQLQEDSPPKANVQQDKAESNSEAAAALKKQLFGKDQPPEKEQSTSAAVPG